MDRLLNAIASSIVLIIVLFMLFAVAGLCAAAIIALAILFVKIGATAFVFILSLTALIVLLIWAFRRATTNAVKDYMKDKRDGRI